ncbi:MAG: protein kinase [Terriglobia bacterium]
MVGRTLGHYRILEKIGAGGMGEVYRAHDERLDRDIALKVLPPSSFADPTARARLLREARTASKLNHPHICTIHEVGEAGGQAYIAMEYVEGRPLSALVAGQSLPIEQALRYGQQIADGLAHAHERGIVHRDLKSANVVITPEGRAKVLDFGLAKRLREEQLEEATRSQASLTAEGAVMGTLAYMAPEQLRGQPADARADVWALGVMLHEMVGGERPFQGNTGHELSSAILTRSPGPLPGKVPAELRGVIERCLAKEPGERYQRGAEVRAALEAIATGAVAPRVEQSYQPAWWRWGLAAAAGIVVVGVLAAAYLFVRTRPTQAPSQVLTIKPLTSFVGWEWGVTWSPDASFIAYGHTKYGHLDIFVMATAGGEPIRLTTSPADEIVPRWSPDNRYLAFLSDRGTGTNVYLIPPLGGPERKLVETHISWLEQSQGALGALGAFPWSPDASELLFSRLRPSGEIALWKINLSTGEQTQLTKPPPGAADLNAAWSFDGERIAFTRSQGGKRSLWLMDAQGGPSASLGTSEPELLLGDEYQNMWPAWAADSQRLVFVSSRGGPMNLWEIEIGSGRLRQLTSGPGPDFLPATSSTGRIAFSPYSHQVDLYWGRVDQPQEEHQRLTLHTRNNFVGRVAPDGQQVVYYSDRTGNYELWLLDRRTGTERQLTDHPATDVMADWSPDGREVVFLSNREGTLQAWVLEIESGRLRRLSEKSLSIPFEPHFGGPRWSPDGKAIGFIAAGEKEEALWVVDPQGENERSALAGVIAFDWYRDSRHVVYTGTAPGGSGTLEMRVADLETGKETILLRGPNAELVVAPDGRGVTYVHAASHLNMHLSLLRLAPPASPGELPRPLGEPQQLTRGEGIWHVHNGGWSPDSQAIVYSRDLDRGDIYVIENYQ